MRGIDGRALGATSAYIICVGLIPISRIEAQQFCNAPIVVAEGPRFVTVTIDPADPTPVSIFVTANGYPGLRQFVDVEGHLACDPIIQTPAQWGTVHVSGSSIIPNTEYLFQAVCDGGAISPPSAATTWKWGDGNNSGVVNLDDILCMLVGFSGNYDVCSQHALDLMGILPSGIINLDDILAVLDAFQGGSYDASAPPPAPLPPVLAEYESITTESVITLSGTAPNAQLVEFSTAADNPLLP